MRPFVLPLLPCGARGNSSSSSFRLPLPEGEWGRERKILLPAVLSVYHQPLHTHTSFPALSLRLQAGPRHPSARFPSFPSPQAAGPGPPSSSHPVAPAPPSPHPATSCIPTLPLVPGSQDPDPSLPPTLHNSARLSPPGAPRPQHKSGAAAKLGSDAAPASSSFSSSFPPPRCPRPDQGRRHRRCS